MLKGSVQPAARILDRVEMRVQEMIYGHRFSTEQIPYMIILETLAVCSQHSLGGSLPDNSEQEKIFYIQPQAKKLRFLLFLDKNLSKIVRRDDLSSAEKWSRWKSLANDQYLTMDKNLRAKGEQDNFSYLDRMFGKDINSLAQAVEIVRSQEIGLPNDRRWTSKFLAIGGPDMVCGDLSSTGGSAGDRRFFARGGEMVYLMLNRSKHVDEVRDHIKRVFFNANDPINRIAKAISGPTSEASSDGSLIGYLPLAEHDMYDQMATDWKNILNINNLPQSHILEPLFRLTGLNLILYFAFRSAELMEKEKPVPIIADLGNGADARLRNAARDYFLLHRTVADQAIEAYVETILEETKWKLLDSQDSEDAYNIIAKEFGYEGKLGKSADPSNQVSELVERTKSRRRNNISKLLVPLSKGIGLIDRRPGVGTWFCLEDSMIVALVLANIEDSNQVELGKFARLLYERYRLIIGPREATLEFKDSPPVGIESFRNNLVAFEERMTRLSLTRRFSDDCAFVINPYRCCYDNEHQ